MVSCFLSQILDFEPLTPRQHSNNPTSGVNSASFSPPTTQSFELYVGRKEHRTRSENRNSAPTPIKKSRPDDRTALQPFTTQILILIKQFYCLRSTIFKPELANVNTGCKSRRKSYSSSIRADLEFTNLLSVKSIHCKAAGN